MSFEWTLKLFVIGFSIFVSVIGFSLWLFERQMDQIKKEVS